MRLPILVFFFLFLVPEVPAHGTFTFTGFLSETEKGVLDEINDARTSPAKYAKKLKKLRQFYDGQFLKEPGKITLVTSEGVSAVDEAIEFLEDAKPVPALKASKGLSMAVRDHVLDQGPKGTVGHQSSDGTSSDERADRYGQWQLAFAENISYGESVPERIVMQLIIDDGVPGRGHRRNLFAKEMAKVGIAFGSHKQYGSMCVIAFAGDYLEAGETSAPAGFDEKSSVELAENPSSDYSYLSQLEYEVVLETNAARTDPKGYAKHLETLREFYKGKYLMIPGETTLITVEGVEAVDEAIKFLKKASPLPALKPSKGMSLGARDHVMDQGPTGGIGHGGSDGSSSAERVSRYGNWLKTVGENIGYGEKTARRIVMQLIIDDGVTSRGHRDNIFQEAFTVTGVAFGPHKVYGKMCVITYAGGFKENR